MIELIIESLLDASNRSNIVKLSRYITIDINYIIYIDSNYIPLAYWMLEIDDLTIQLIDFFHKLSFLH